MSIAEQIHAQALLDWYDRNGRRFPWRAAPGGMVDAYRVWLSEIMLQQTATATAEPYFTAFIQRWPRLEDLANASLDDVLHAWQGLGYYARARNLHRCAKIVSGQLGGRFPESETALRALPGIGPYTAAAIAAIAFGQPSTVVDGNIERVISRLFDVDDPLPESKARLRRLATSLTPRERAGDYAQAMMDLGATVCRAKKPRCPECPLGTSCAGRGRAAQLPRRSPRPARPTRYGIAFALLRADSAILLRRRPDKGLLGGLMEIPSTPWRDQPWPWPVAQKFAPCAIDWRPLTGTVGHSFTHFHLRIDVVVGHVVGGEIEGVWCPPDQLSRHALSTAMKKVIRHVFQHKSGDGIHIVQTGASS